MGSSHLVSERSLPASDSPMGHHSTPQTHGSSTTFDQQASTRKPLTTPIPKEGNTSSQVSLRVHDLSHLISMEIRNIGEFENGKECERCKSCLWKLKAYIDELILQSLIDKYDSDRTVNVH